MNAVFILLIILTLARLWIGLQLYLTARRSKRTNLYWLAGLFILAVYSIFTPTPDSPIGNYWFFHLGFVAGHFCLVMFIHTTFYRNRKSPVAVFLGLVGLAFIVDVYALAVNDLNLAGIISVISVINWTWHLVIAWSAYKTIAADPSVENWIKARYQLMIVYVPMMILISVQVVASSTDLSPFVPRSLLPIGLLIIIASIILQFLVWVMPEPFRLWLNREQKARPADEEQQPLSVLDVFGTAMTENTGLKSMACLYAIRTAVGKRIGSEDSDLIRAYINAMPYYEWDTIFQHAELRRILVNSGADYEAANKAIDNARRSLTEKQSLLTLSTR